MNPTIVKKGKIAFLDADRTSGRVEELDSSANSYNPPLIYEFIEDRPLPNPIGVGILVNFIHVTTPTIPKIARDIRMGNIG
ncbi:MAG: hypothetical protein A3H98_03470 [Bacteroidetes bacterium RIFCSPLOWO2_02_FULL_36_8]|nr:MAG: hypothetical protein A3H98_03470 [Bacteroidetes bacterium RIFCSPLOWO2_02_FULL_36_8]OFY69501.1 MAG: hypothetical protein A3G23_10715 [Bacteroidetes bacterium RIFCSPLOWO2_12_FULL_37_12]